MTEYKFNVPSRFVLVELPTKTDFGLILINQENKSLEEGWFKVIKVGKDVVEIKEGMEAYIFFHNKPYTFDELTFKSRKEQKEKVERLTALSHLTLPENSKDEDLREFALVPESSCLFYRDYE